MRPSQRKWCLAGPLALAVLLASTAAAAARSLPDPCFSCMEQPTCAYPEPADGTVYSLTILSAPQPPEQPAGTAPTLLDELAGKALMFTLKYKQKAFVEVDGRLISLGRYNPEKSTDFFHVFDSTRPASATRGSVRAIVELRCKENIRVDKLLRVSASFDEDEEASSKPKRITQPPADITFTYIIPTNRACGLPVCASKGGVLPPGEYLMYKPPLLRQECPGAFLSAPSCKSGRDALQLFPLGRQLGERQQWRITSAAAAAGGAAPGAGADGYEEAGYEEDDDEEIDLVGQPVLIQNVARSARMCASHLNGGGLGGCATAGGGATVAHAAEQWVFEPGPLGPAGAMVHQFYIRAKSLADAGCERSYLCLELTCGATNLQLCSKDDRQYSTLWNVRPTDISGVLMRSWGMA